MLTEHRIREAKPRQKTYIIWDNKVKGLGARITPAGVKAYILNYRVAGRERRATLARVSELSLKAARERAGQELSSIRAGGPGLLEKRRKMPETPTVAEGLARFFDEYVPARIAIGRMTERTAKEYGKQARRYVEPALKNLRVAEVKRLHVERMIKPLPNATRNRVLAFVSRLFSLFEAWEWRPQNTNPTRNVERAREVARDRILSPSELAALAKALNDAEDATPTPVAAIRFTAITGLRIGEVLAMRWEHVEFESRRLLLPETKTGRRFHDLPSAALAILANLPRINQWVFTTGRDAPVTYRTVRKHFANATLNAGLENVRLHDLRRTVMTQAAAAGIGTHVLRDLLGHKTTTMADRYIRMVGNPVRDAREQVGAVMAAMISGENDAVVPVIHNHE